MTKLKPNSLKRKIYERLMSQPNVWFHSGELERMADELGYLPSNGSRRARDLVTDGFRVERKKENGSELFRYVPTQTLIDPVSRTARIIDPLINLKLL